MKKYGILLLLSFIFFFSCKREEIEDLQKIDQILHIYIKNIPGHDLLNTDVPAAFYKVELKDLGALRDRVPISASTLTNDNGTKYIQYISGANRTLQEGGTDNRKIYLSKIAVQYMESSSSEITEDTMEIYYEWTPQIFQILKINYNGEEIFTKIANQPNVITIIK